MEKEEIEKLKGIVNEAFLVDLNIDNRKRETVDARKIYSKILRDSGYSYQAIGKTINKNHATIIHYIKNIEHLLSYDKVLYFKYVACKDVFFSKKDADVTIKDKLLDEFFNYIEDYEKRTGRLPNSHECKHHILPLFNK